MMRTIFLMFLLAALVSARGFENQHVCGSYEPVSKLSGNLVHTSFVIKGDHQVSSIYEIVENYAVQSVVTDNTTVSGSLKKISSINDVKLAYPTIGEPWFNFRLNTHSVYFTFDNDLTVMNITCNDSIIAGVSYNVSEVNCFYEGEDVMSSYKKLVKSDVTMSSSFLFNDEEMYFGDTIFRRTSSEGCNNDFGWNILVVLGIILVLLLIVALVTITILYVRLRMSFKAKVAFLADQGPDV